MATNNAIDAPLPLAGSQGGTGVANTGLTITLGGNVVTEEALSFSGAFAFTGTLTGVTTVTFPTSGTLATTSQTITPVIQNTSSATLAVNTMYVTDNGASLVTYTLPTTAAAGTVIEIVGKSSGLWTIAQSAGQSIRIGSTTSTVGVGGSVSARLESDCVRLVCITADTTWTNTIVQGNLTVV